MDFVAEVQEAVRPVLNAYIKVSTKCWFPMTLPLVPV